MVDFVAGSPSRHVQSPDLADKQNVVDIPDPAGLVSHSKAVYSFRMHGSLAGSAARMWLPSLVQELLFNLTGQ
jgi:hypothetical protein